MTTTTGTIDPIARELAARAWGPTINTATELIPGTVWEFSTPSHGGYVATFPIDQLPYWAVRTYAGRIEANGLAYVAFEEDCDAAILLYHDAAARRAVYDNWHPDTIETFAAYTAFIAGWYAYIRNYHAITA